MEGECFNCVGPTPTSETYTLILETGNVLQDKQICEECLTAFREEEWIEVQEGPVLMRGEDDHSQDKHEK